MQVYAHGSAATRHSVDHAGLALGDRLNWMGVKASQWTQLGVKYDDLLPLKAQDHSKVSQSSISHATSSTRVIESRLNCLGDVNVEKSGTIASLQVMSFVCPCLPAVRRLLCLLHQHGTGLTGYRRELQQMLHLQRKAEIQIVDNLSAYVVCGIVSGT
jgi:hypothetical protein